MITYVASFVPELLQKQHDLYSDVFKLALYSSAASIGSGTTAYSSSDEVSGIGYTAGGKTLVMSSGYPARVNTVGVVFRFDPVIWDGATIAARYGLIYNSSASNKAVMVLDWGDTISVTGSDFEVNFKTTLPPLWRFGA